VGRYTTVSIPVELYRKLEELIRGSGFSSVSEFVVYVLREVLAVKRMSGSPSAVLTPEEVQRIREKLEALGYL
jgi:Arc/MetJ-type ribon-helix-helix transcriptional regulator